MYETLSTFLWEDDDKKVQLSYLIGKLAQKLILNYLAIISEETVLPPHVYNAFKNGKIQTLRKTIQIYSTNQLQIILKGKNI